jgi:hypothetical protein
MFYSEQLNYETDVFDIDVDTNNILYQQRIWSIWCGNIVGC